MAYPYNNGMISATRGLAILVVICLLRYFDTFADILGFNQVGIVPGIIAMLVLLSGMLAAVGLMQDQKWGFLPLYFFIPAVTMFFKFSLIPYLPSLLEPEYQRIVVVVLNCGVLVYAVLLLLRMMDSNVIVQTGNSQVKGW